MNDTQYLQHNLANWQAFSSTLVQRTRELEADNPLRALALGFEGAGQSADSLYNEGIGLVSRLFTHFPEFAPTFPRELLWFLGGECLHFMPEDEIALYQKLDEERNMAAERGEVIDFEQARARLLQAPK